VAGPDDIGAIKRFKIIAGNKGTSGKVDNLVDLQFSEQLAHPLLITQIAQMHRNARHIAGTRHEPMHSISLPNKRRTNGAPGKPGRTRYQYPRCHQ
jgi:hypothetical protein